MSDLKTENMTEFCKKLNQIMEEHKIDFCIEGEYNYIEKVAGAWQSLQSVEINFFLKETTKREKEYLLSSVKENGHETQMKICSGDVVKS